MTGSESSAATAADEQPRGSRLGRAAAVFLDRRVLIVMLLGFSSGLPLALSGSTLTIWMADRGVDLRTIGLFALVGIPYTLKFLWAPIVDAWMVPLLGRLLGRRRGWLVLSQLLVAAAILFLGGLDPVSAPFTVALAALLVAVASATQDIVIDAFRVEYLETDKQAAGMAWFVAAYRIGMLLSGAGAIGFVAYLESAGADRADVWFWGYALMAVFMLIGLAAALLAEEPKPRPATEKEEAELEGIETRRGNPLARLARTFVLAFADFLTKRDAVLILLFVVAFKLCDTFAGVMTGPFVLALGFDKAAYAGIVKGVGLAAALIGGAVGGLIARAARLSTALWIAALLQMASNLVFCWQAWMGLSHTALTFTIVVENFTGAIGTVIFVAYLSGLCTSPAHTATQFALLTALAAVGRTFLSAFSGYVAASTGWTVFFALTALAALPSFALLWWLQRRGDFEAIETEERSGP